MNITKYLTNCIVNKIPVSFSKYGDGEYHKCIFNDNMYTNCDDDLCTPKLKMH